ncbi:hypothetical protein OSTOST_19019 [Ostertagia ostertagi]
MIIPKSLRVLLRIILRLDIGRSLWLEKRSMSVRDLNGEEFDFSNKDSVTRWTSQILAELDSLPSSCVNLTETEKVDGPPLFFRKVDRNVVKDSYVNDNRKFSTDSSWESLKFMGDPADNTLAIETASSSLHRQSMYEARGLNDKLSASGDLMTSSVIEPMTTAFGSAKVDLVAFQSCLKTALLHQSIT